MKRLVYPKKTMVFNSFSVADIGVYKNEKTASNVLHFKKEGRSLESGWGTDMAGNGSTLSTAPNVKSATVAYTDDGYFKGKLVQVVAPAKNEDINYGYGLTIRKLVKVPGVNTSQTNTYEKTYTGEMPVVSTSGGYVTAAGIKIMEDTLIDGITNDTYMHVTNTDITTNFAGSIVTAKKATKLTTTAANTNTVTITPDADTGDSAETILLNGGTTIITQVADFNDDNTLGFKAYALGTQEMIIVGPAGYKAVITAAVATVGNTYLLLESKDQNVKFDVGYVDGFAIVQGWNLFTLTCSAATAQTAGVQMIIDGTATAATAATTPATLAAELTSDAGGKAYSTVEGTTPLHLTVNLVSLNTDMGLTSLDIKLPAVNTYTRTASTTSQGKYPSLTSDEVFRANAFLKDPGKLAAMQYLDQPTDGADYAKYVIETYVEIDGIPAASEISTGTTTTVIYALKSAAQASVWDKSDLYIDAGESNPVSADASFEFLLAAWCDLPVTSW